jgi:prefoldin subunit 4
VPVRREDQDRINRFSRLTQRESVLKEELALKSKEKEELDDLSTELELADEDEKVPYRVGESFFHVPVEKAQEMLQKAQERVDDEVSVLEDKMSAVQDEMTKLKVELYARFGKGINLDV